MKIAVLKLGSRIAISGSGTSGGTGETLSIIKMLTTGGADVTAYTKVLSKDEAPKDFSIKNIEDEYLNINDCGYDALVVLNGNVNYFGGVDDPSQTLNYHIINNFKGKVVYILCDVNLILKQIWPSIEKKAWASNYKREDIEIKRRDIVCISQPRKVALIKDKELKAGIMLANVIHYPFEKFPLLTLKDNVYNFNENPIYDLSYGGTFRSGKREDDMIKFYFGYNEKFKVDLSSQTLDVTTFKEIQTGDFVNLERAMQIGERLGGHIVSGHVDFVAEFVDKNEKDNSVFLTFEIPENKSKYFIDKGSVTINGISLTIAEKNNNKITVCIIPHTLENTNLKYLEIGQNVNIEIDVIAKYVENFVVSNDNNSSITENFLKENGF